MLGDDDLSDAQSAQFAVLRLVTAASAEERVRVVLSASLFRLDEAVGVALSELTVDVSNVVAVREAVLARRRCRRSAPRSSRDLLVEVVGSLGGVGGDNLGVHSEHRVTADENCGHAHASDR